jgi:hypothetical protein
VRINRETEGKVGGQGKLLSKAGKEVLLKAVAQAIPVYAMSCFRLPDGLFQELNSLMSNFWWGKGDKGGKMHWVSWEKLCYPKSGVLVSGI